MLSKVAVVRVRILLSFLILNFVVPYTLLGDDVVPKAVHSTPPPIEVGSLDQMAHLTISFNSFFTAFLALRHFPEHLQNAYKSAKELWNLRANRKDFLEFLKTDEKARLASEKLIKELEQNLGLYKPAFEAFDSHLRSLLADPESSYSEAEKAMDLTISKLMTIGGLPGNRDVIERSVDHWLNRRDPMALEQWIDQNLKAIEQHSEANIWLNEYTTEMKRLAAREWTRKNSTAGMNRWATLNKNRLFGKSNQEAKWIQEFERFRDEEASSAKIFLGNYAVFIRGINSRLPEAANKYAVLRGLESREPGEFHTMDNGTPVPILHNEIVESGKRKCKALLTALDIKKSELALTGSYRRIPGQMFRVVTPLATGAAGIGSTYVAYRGIVKIIKGPEKKESQPK